MQHMQSQRPLFAAAVHIVPAAMEAPTMTNGQVLAQAQLLIELYTEKMNL